MNQTLDQFTDIQNQLQTLSSDLDINAKQKELEQLERQTQAPDFWQDDQKAKSVMRQISSIRSLIEDITTLESKTQNLIDLINLYQDSDEKVNQQEIDQEFGQINKNFKSLKLRSYLSGKHDNKDAILSIHAGQGGTEAQDWAHMLLRMYMRYFELKDWDYEVTEETRGDEAGIKSATIMVNADYAYGYLKGEAGTHRLVRLSPFNADNLRQTSFAGVEVLPILDNDQEINIPDSDLDWQFFRSQGAGGQNVNKVSTAVRLTHIPTGTVVTSQSQRQQQQNRKIALEILTAKLWQIEEEKQQKLQDKIKGSHKVAGFGNQIRSYVLHPYQMVKDLRTEHETSDTAGVLDGQIDDFIEAELSLN